MIQSAAISRRSDAQRRDGWLTRRRFDDLKAQLTIKQRAGEFSVPERSFSDEIHQLRKANGEDFEARASSR